MASEFIEQLGKKGNKIYLNWKILNKVFLE